MSRIHEYLPETLKDVIDLKLLNEDLDIELEQLDGYITGIGKEVIVKSASLYGIQKWEKALGITPKDGDSLETRRFRVNNLLTSKLPYTYRWLIQKLTQITGSPSGYTLNINQADYAITIVLSGLDTNMMIEVQKQLRNAIPSNMVLEIGGPPLVSADIKVGMALRIGTKYVIKSAKTGLPAGKNLYNKYGDFNYPITGWINGTTLQSDGTIKTITNFSSNASKGIRLLLEPNTEYTLSGKLISSTGTGQNSIAVIRAMGYSSSWSALKNEHIGSVGDFNFTFNSGDNNDWFISLNANGSTGSSYQAIFNNIQVEKGSTATAYEPFIEL